MAIYQFILTPLDKFYFGKEKHPIRPSYFMESNPFPQQTGILGLIRHYLLLATGKIDIKDDWDNLIGIKSFDGSKNQIFGKINKVYPLFIYKEDEQKVLLPFKDLSNLVNTNISDINVSFNNIDVSQLNTISSVINSVKLSEQLNMKEHFFNDCFIPSNYSKPVAMICKKEIFSTANFFDQKTKKLNINNGIFIKHLQPGILKNYNASSQDDAYFKTQYYKLNRNYHFSFLADIDELLDDSKNIFITFGGEASSYKVSIKKENIPDVNLFTSQIEGGNIVHFISDTILSHSAYRNIAQFVGTTQHFRSMKTDAKNNLNDLFNLKKGNADIFSDSKLLIKKGSIAFINPVKLLEFINTINEDQINKTYKKIGYNYFKQLNTLKNEQ